MSILGLESYYGRNQGNINTMQAVSTLAFDRRRSEFYKKQLIAALKIIDTGISSENLVGSWGGAIGMSQFIPTTYLDSGYDWNKDGMVDIWNDYEDVFASIAISVPAAITTEAGLSFLGLGDPSFPTWGQILHDANTYGAAAQGFWWWIVPPGLLIAITGLAFVFIGNTLDTIVNPKLKR